MKGLFDKIRSFFQTITRFVFLVPPFFRKKFDGFLKKHPAIDRIYNLTGMQIANGARYKTTTSIWRKVILLLLQIALFVGLIFLFRGLILLVDTYVFTPSDVSFDKEYLSLVLSIYIVFTVIEMSASLVNTLYKAKDNAMLFVYPVNPGEIFISKLLVKYIKEVKKMIFFIVPFLLAFYMQKHAVPMAFISWTYILKVFPVFILLPFILVLLSGVISILFSLIDTLFKRIPIVKFVLSISLLVGAFSILIVLINGLPTNQTLISLWTNSIIRPTDNVINQITPNLPFGHFITLFLTGRIVWQTLLILLAFIALIALLVLINSLLSYRFFFKLSGSATERGSSKIRKTKDKLRKSIFLSFFLKEVKTYFRNEEGTLFNTLLVIALPLTVYCLNKLFMIMDISSFGKILIITVDILMSLTIITSVNISCANALSREGDGFYLLKVSPLNTSSIAYAKILFNAILTTISAVSIAVALKIVSMTSLGNTNVLGDMDIMFIFIVSLFVGIGHLFLCIELDLVNPKVRQYAAGDKDTSNIGKALAIGIIISILMTVATFFFLQIARYGDFKGFEMVLRWLSVAIVAAIFLVSRIILFTKKLNAYFEDIV